VLKLIQKRFGLKPLSVRNAAANNLAEALALDPDPDDGEK
jgi:hypothetical protein